MSHQIATTSSVITTDVDYMSDLNERCLIKIFDDLNFEDLMKMCFIKDRFFNIIAQNIIGHRTLDLKQIVKTYPISKVFEFFGPHITKMRINTEDTVTAEILRLIANSCKAEKLTELELNVTPLVITALQQLVPILQNLHTLRLFYGKGRGKLSYFSHIFRNNSNLKVLNIREFSLLNFDGLDLPPNLIELTIDDCIAIGSDMLKNYFIRNPNLKKFGFKAVSTSILRLFGQPPLNMLENIVECLPNLETLSFETGKILEQANVNRDKLDLILNLEQLKRLTLTSYSGICVDLHGFLKKLAIQNTLEELTITVHSRSPSFLHTIWNTNFPAFSSLQTLEIVNPTRDTQYFLYYFVQKTTNLAKLVFRSTASIPQSIIYNPATQAPELTILCIESPRTAIYHLYIDLYRKFKQSKTSPCELCVCEEQSRKFFGAKNRFYDPSVLKITYPIEN